MIIAISPTKAGVGVNTVPPEFYGGQSQYIFTEGDAIH